MCGRCTGVGITGGVLPSDGSLMGGNLSSDDGCPTKICPRSVVSVVSAVSESGVGDSGDENGSSWLFWASGKKDFSDDDDNDLWISGATEFLISCVRVRPSSSITSGDDSLRLLSLSLCSGESSYLLKPVS